MKVVYICEATKDKSCHYKTNGLCGAYNGKKCDFKKKERWKTYWHGTSKERAEKILKEGFKPWTYFAKSIEQSLFMGGEYIFGVAFQLDKFKEPFHKDPEAWQFMNSKWIKPDKIIALHHIKLVKTLFHNKTLRWFVFKTNVNVTRRKLGQKKVIK